MNRSRQSLGVWLGRGKASRWNNVVPAPANHGATFALGPVISVVIPFRLAFSLASWAVCDNASSAPLNSHQMLKWAVHTDGDGRYVE